MLLLEVGPLEGDDLVIGVVAISENYVVAGRELDVVVTCFAGLVVADVVVASFVGSCGRHGYFA